MRAGLRLLLATTTAICAAAPVRALPVGPVVVQGTPGTGPATTFATTPGALTITQANPRLAIDWASFNIAKGEQVAFVQGAANWIAFNRIAQGSTIDGALSATGGVWLFSPGGLVFGPNAQVNVGSLFAATGVLSDPELAKALRGEGFALDSNATIGDGVAVSAGARLTAKAGDVVLQGETVRQDGTVSASRGVAYVAADGASFRYIGDPDGISLAPESVAALPAGSAPRIDHGGDTRAAGRLQVIAQAAAGRRSVVNLSGYLEAGDLSGGASDALRVAAAPSGQIAAPAGLSVDAGAATLVSAGGVRVEADATRLGAVRAKALTVRAGGALTLDGAIDLTGGADLRGDGVRLNAALTAGGDVDAFSLDDIVVGAAVRARGVVDLYARRDLRIGTTLVESDSGGGGASALYLTAGRDLTAVSGSELLAGAREGGVRSSAILVAGNETAGNLTIDQLTGRTLDLFAAGDSGGGGLLTTTGPLTATRDIDVETVGKAGSGLRLLGSMMAGGEVRGFTFGGGGIEIGAGARLTSDADGIAGGAPERVYFTSTGALTVGEGAALSAGDSLILQAATTLSVLPGATLASRGGARGGTLAYPLVRTPVTEDDGLPVGGVSLAGADIDLRGTVTSGLAGDRRDVFVRLYPVAGLVHMGGADGDAGRLSNTELQRLTGRTVYLAADKGDVVVDDLTLDLARIGKLWLGVASNGALTVSGKIRPGAGGAPDLAIGFIRSLDETGGDLTSYLPRELAVTGSLGGAGTERLGAVALAAKGDILIGSPRFVADARADSSFDPLRRSAQYAADVTPGQLFIGADTLQVAATGRVLQQNTGSGVTDAGVLVGAPGTGRPNIVALPSVGLTAPLKVELFGAFSTATGTITGPRPATTPGVLDGGVQISNAYRFNGCVIAATTACSIADSPAVLPQPQLQPAQIVTPLALSENGRTGNVFDLPKEEDYDREEDGFAQPVTGVGNDDLSSTRPGRETTP